MNLLFPAGGVDIQFTPPVEFTGRKLKNFILIDNK